MRKVLPALLILAFQSGAIAVPVPSAPASNTLTGSVTVWDNIFPVVSKPYTEPRLNGEACATERGFSDIQGGQKVVIRDASDKIVAIGELSDGKYKKDTLWTCVFSFSVPEIPESKFYTIAIGGRKPIAASLEELKTKGWTLDLSIGL